MLFDTHAHMNDPAFDEDREQILLGLKDKGVAMSMPTMAATSSGYFCFHRMASRPDMEWGVRMYGPVSPARANACRWRETSVSISQGDSQISE